MLVFNGLASNASHGYHLRRSKRLEDGIDSVGLR